MRSCVHLLVDGEVCYGQYTEYESCYRLNSYFLWQQAGEESNVEEVEESDAEDSDDADVEQAPTSVLQTLLHFYKEAIAMNDEMRICDIEAHLRSIENERDLLSQQVATLTEELLIQKERFLRLNADFDNFRKRSEQERLSLASNVQADVIESLFPILDNFERAKSQIKTETEGEEKINNGYQSIYKQFDEIMKALGITVVETVGKRFDPMAVNRWRSEGRKQSQLLSAKQMFYHARSVSYIIRSINFLPVTLTLVVHINFPSPLITFLSVGRMSL
eukprot:Gb_00616 [translate_table: standard]